MKMSPNMVPIMVKLFTAFSTLAEIKCWWKKLLSCPLNQVKDLL